MNKRAIAAALVFFPLTAILHHAVFYRPTCILNYFGQDYTIESIGKWLSADPSAYIAAVVAAGIAFATHKYPKLWIWVIAFVLAFLPLSVWIWDIPFTGRIICHTFHDGRVGFRTIYMYALGALAFFPMLFLLHKSHQ